MDTPQWLNLRGGGLRRGSDGRTWYVLLSGAPQYSLVPVPVEGKFGVSIKQTINGERIESKSIAATSEESIRAGLEDLRQALGW